MQISRRRRSSFLKHIVSASLSGVMVFSALTSLLMSPDAASAATTSKTVMVQNSDSNSTAVKGQAVTRQLPDFYYNTAQLTLGNDTNEVRPYIQFDLSSIPADATLTNATLELTSIASTFNRNDVSATVSVYRVMDAWDENTITWNSASAFAPDPVLTQQVNGFATASKTQFDLTSLVQQWIDGIVPNYGIVLRSEHFPSGNWVRRYYSDDHLTMGPKLTVTYTVNDLMVTPSQLSLVKGGSGAQLTARVDPDGGMIPSVTWATYDSSIATVDANGFVIPGNTPGTTTITATTVDGRKATSAVTVSTPNADLSNLALSEGTLSPVFSSGTVLYGATVTNDVYSLTVTPTTADVDATLTVNGQLVKSGTPSQAIPLNVGDNEIIVKVMAQDGTTTKTYTIVVTRLNASSPAPDNSGGSGYYHGGSSSGLPVSPSNPSKDKPNEPKDTEAPSEQPKGAACPQLAWMDTQRHWARSYIDAASQYCLIKGVSDDKFLPDGELTRLQFALMIARAMKLEQKENVAVLEAFKDRKEVPSWAEAELPAAIQAGVIIGYDDNTLRPNQKISRAEMATMLIRGWGMAASNAGTPFADDADIPKWAKGYVAKAAEISIIIGRTQNRFDPSGSATRAEAAVVLVNMLKDKP